MSEKQNIIKNELTAANPCDLHVHTTHSDASRTVAQVIEYAAMIGLKYIAITDHDTMAGVDEAVELGGKLGVHVVPGVEMSTLDEESGRNVHLLCYLPKDRQMIDGFLENTLKWRREQKLEMARRVHEIYPLVTPELVESYAKDSESIYECHVMQPLCDFGYTNVAIGELMRSLISSKGSCYVPKRYPTTLEAVTVIREAGGVPVVAHAEQFDSFELIERYAKEGLLAGVEVWHPRNGTESRQRLLEIAKKYDLLTTGGSDFHGQYTKKPHPLGFCGCEIADVEATLARK